jgi:hypothetical protein
MNGHARNTGSKATHVSYLLRLWRDDEGEKGSRSGAKAWRASLQNPHTGRRLGFASLDALCEYLRAETGADSASPDRGRCGEGSHRPRMWMMALGVLILTLSVTGCVSVAADNGTAGTMPPVSISSNPGQAAGVEVTLSAAHTTTSWDDRDPARVKFDLPLLYLHHEGAATPPSERTLNLSIAGIPVGSAVQVDIVSLHENPNTGDPHTASKRFTLLDRPCTIRRRC